MKSGGRDRWDGQSIGSPRGSKLCAPARGGVYNGIFRIDREQGQSLHVYRGTDMLVGKVVVVVK